MEADKFEAEKSLKKSMQQEISIMRELLSNLLAETSCLVLNEEASRSLLMQNRSMLLQELTKQRQERDLATKIIGENSSMDSFLSHDSNICEIPLLIDQIIALNEKINEQNAYNQNLLQQRQHLVAISPQLAYPNLKQSPTRRKNNLMTI